MPKYANKGKKKSKHNMGPNAPSISPKKTGGAGNAHQTGVKHPRPIKK